MKEFKFIDPSILEIDKNKNTNYSNKQIENIAPDGLDYTEIFSIDTVPSNDVTTETQNVENSVVNESNISSENNMGVSEEKTSMDLPSDNIPKDMNSNNLSSDSIVDMFQEKVNIDILNKEQSNVSSNSYAQKVNDAINNYFNK